jgi:hypothetical protein
VAENNQSWSEFRTARFRQRAMPCDRFSYLMNSLSRFALLHDPDVPLGT